MKGRKGKWGGGGFDFFDTPGPLPLPPSPPSDPFAFPGSGPWAGGARAGGGRYRIGDDIGSRTGDPGAGGLGGVMGDDIEDRAGAGLGGVDDRTRGREGRGRRRGRQGRAKIRGDMGGPGRR